MPTAIYTGASLGGPVPCVRTGQIIIPERPASALARPDRINCASFLALVVLQKDAVFGGWLFYDCRSQTVTFEVLFSQFGFGYLQKIRNEFDLRLAHPDVSFGRARAAPPALHALEIQTANIPDTSLAFRHLAHHFKTAPVSALVAIDAYFAR